MIRAACYCRVSTDRQASEGDSIPAQRAAIRKYIDERADMVCAGEYIDDGVSGTKADRDELVRLLEDVKQGKIDLICVCKLDRLYRSLRHYLNMMDVLDKYGVGWVAIWEPIYDTTTPQGRLIVSQMMSIAQFEAENTGQRIRQVFDYKISRGEVVTGNCPLGYSIVDKHLTPNEDAELVRDLFAHYNQYNNLNDLVRYAQGRGLVRTKRGLKEMLKCSKYIGEWRGNPNYCEPIIDRTLFEQVQRKLSMNIKNGRKYDYIFSGLVYCDVCGKRYAGIGAHGHVRYRCPRHVAKLCENSASISQRTIEEYLLENVRELLHGRKLEYKQREIKQRKTANALRKLEQKRDRLKDLYLNGLITLDEYKHDRAEIDAEIDVQGAESASRPSAPINLPSDFETLYSGFTAQEKRYLWRGVIKQIRVRPDRSFYIIFL